MRVYDTRKRLIHDAPTCRVGRLGTTSLCVVPEIANVLSWHGQPSRNNCGHGFKLVLACGHGLSGVI